MAKAKVKVGLARNNLGGFGVSGFGQAVGGGRGRGSLTGRREGNGVGESWLSCCCCYC